MKKQTVYLPVKVEDITKHPNITLIDIRGVDTFCSEQEAFVFTPKELNEYTAKIGKAFLQSAAENIGFIETTSEKLNSEEYKPFITADDGTVWTIDKQSILNTFKETFKKFGV